MNPKTESYHPIVLDCNIWISKLLQKKSEVRKKLIQEEYQVLLTSYMVVEILRVLKRVSSRISISFSELEVLFWNLCAHPFVKLDFRQSLTEALITEVKRIPEYQIIAKFLELEIKDIPYLVAAFQHHAILVTGDLRSIITKRQLIGKHLGLTILTTTEFLAL